MDLAGLDLKKTLSILKQNLRINIKNFIGGNTINNYRQFYIIVYKAKKKEFEKRCALRSASFGPSPIIRNTTSQFAHKLKDKLSTIPLRPCKICPAFGFHGPK